MACFKPQIIIPALQLLVGVVLIQWHSVVFWTETVDPHTGWALSMMIEVVALSFWWSRNVSYRFLALTATVVLLAGPTYDLGKPVYQDIREAMDSGTTNAAVLTRLKDKRQELKSNLETFRKSVEFRPGFGELVVQATTKISAIDREIQTLQDETIVRNRVEWETIIPVGMYIWVLFLVQINNVRMIRLLARAWPAMYPAQDRPRSRSGPRLSSVQVVRTHGKSGRLGVRLRGETFDSIMN